MDILFNGVNIAIPEACTIAQLLQLRDLAAKRVAVEVNGRIVPRSAHESEALATDDRVEVVRALGGG